MSVVRHPGSVQPETPKKARTLLLAKKLQLAVSELTDVGRRRERNQDNVTHFVPSNEDVLAEKGALFVVCDGMGGHAAGEVAAEFGVNTIRDVYYSTHDDDIISGLANAVKVANETIFNYARHHPEMTGMGTTCVALTVHDGRGYFLNIGDSRAYVVRDGTMRQITLDHSWVAEQVRAGLLTEEQARTHAHRNVITRSLGTQPNVSADLFIETLRDGDRILLCSDGLHGYVDEAAIEREILVEDDPEVATHHLIDMANANGGPDNITALLVHLLEVPAATGEILLPGGIPATEEQVATQPIPVVTGKVGKATKRRSPERFGQPAALAPAPVAKRRGPRSAAVLALRLLAVAAMLVLAAGVWDFGFGPYAATRAAAARLQTDVSRAQNAAQGASSQDPANALITLASARQHVVGDLQSPQLDAQSRAAAENVLDTQLAPAVRSTVQRYNAAALITPVTFNTAVPYSVTCTAAGAPTPTALTTVDALAAVTAPAGAPNPPHVATVYALSGGDLYQITVPLDANGLPASSSAGCVAVALPGVSTTLAIAADGPGLYALSQVGSSGYAIFSILPNGANADGSTRVKVQQFFTVPTPHAEAPTTIAADGANIYIGYKGDASGSSGIWLFSGSTPKTPSMAAPLPQPAVSLAAANGTVYALLADGSLGQLDTTHTYLQLPMQVLPPVTAADPTTYTSSAPVPTPPASATPAATATTSAGGTPAGTLFGSGASLAGDPAQRTNILLGDPASSRVVRFLANQTGQGLSLNAQYVYGAPLTNVKGLALSTAGTTLTVFAWSGSQLNTFSIPEPTAG